MCTDYNEIHIVFDDYCPIILSYHLRLEIYCSFLKLDLILQNIFSYLDHL